MSRLEETQRIVDFLYSDVDGYAISRTDREGALENDKSFIYGEVLLESLAKLLDVVAPQSGEVFYDLGSGTGKLVMMAHLLYPFSRCTGVEFLPSLHAQALAVLARYDQEVRPSLVSKRGAIFFNHGDMLHEDISQADIIFLHGTCFDEAFSRQLEE